MDLRQALHNAVAQLLRPLVKVLLRHGLAYDEFAELARRTYVDVAERDFGLQGRKQTASRISVITGLHRKEVARLQALNAQVAHGDANGADLARTMNRAARVVAGWLSEHPPASASAASGALVDSADGPQAIDAEQFAALVRRHSGDMPPRAVLDELRHAGALTVADDGRLHLSARGYVPQQADARKIALLGQHAADLLGSIEHNLANPPEQAWLQQRVFADHIPADRVDAVRAQLRASGLQALAQTRETLVEHDGGDAPAGPGARRVTLGVYYFEEPALPIPAANGEKE
ncbi:MAG: hypothetical protein AD742_00625 [Methylibium sp. NZG]|nr:MAG: hypothetical protein AD742_00625 [Methylibium sp. NZG]